MNWKTRINDCYRMTGGSLTKKDKTMTALNEIEEALKSIKGHLERLPKGIGRGAMSPCYGEINEALTQLAALREDFVMVPREPTDEMIQAGISYRANNFDQSCRFIYRAMIAAAQTTEKPNA